jgi:6-pyruvoyltetrahydropterin/6-carboxytetrahydropterin synthase
MYGIIIRDTFSAAHYLRGYKGKCERIHGHNYLVEVQIEGENLDNIGILWDFNEGKELLRGILEELDHSLLNKDSPLGSLNPTAENIARFIFQKIRENLPSHLRLKRVIVWENQNSAAYYEE